MKVRLSTRDIRHCANPRCKTTKPPLYRHHMGNDGLLKQFSKKLAKNYKRYFYCVLLCEDCHCEVHFFYSVFATNEMQNLYHNERQMDKIRQLYIHLCSKWLTLESKVIVPEFFKSRWRGSRASWYNRTRGS